MIKSIILLMLQQWLKLGKKVIDSNFERLDRPYKLTYVVTKECHSKCLNCDIWKVKPQNELTLEEIRKFAKNSPFLSWIDFTGGEPTDRPDFVELVMTFVEHCDDLLLVHFPTNGLKPKRISQFSNKLVELGTPRLVVTVSIDGPQELNDRLRGIPGDFKRAVETFALLSQIPKLQVYVGMTLYKENTGLIKQTVAEIQEILPSFGYKDLHANIPHVSDHYYENTGASPQATLEMADAIDELARLRGFPLKPFEWVERMYHRRVRRYLDTKECPQDCAALMSSCFLAEDGSVYPCNIWSEKLGNIRESDYSLLPLLQSENAATLRERLLKKDCPNCWTPCEAYQTLAANLFS